MFVYLHNCCFISTSVAVVRRWEYSHYISFLGPIIAVHNKLMSSSNKFEVVCMIKLLRNVLTKSISSSSRWDTPTAPVVRIRPQKVAHWPFVRHLLHSIELLDLFKSVDRGWEPSMKAEDLIFNNRGNRKGIEEICKVLPDVGVSVLSKALVVKPIYLSDLPGLVVSSEDSNSFLKSDFKGNEQSDSFDWVVSSVNVVSHEKIVCLRKEAPDLEKFVEVSKLAMYVSTNSDRYSYCFHIRFLKKNVFRLHKN